MRITIFTDNEKSWFVPYGRRLTQQLAEGGAQVDYVFEKSLIKSGDICFLLSCSYLVEPEYLERNEHNIVVHASDLPKGKGFSPLQWQVLEGKNEIVLTLFEATKDADAGGYYLKEKVEFNGTELLPELREKLAERLVQMCLTYTSNYSRMAPVPQTGQESFYPKRTIKDEELDVNKTLAQLFNQLRISDNDKFPAHFWMNGNKYILKIYKAGPPGEASK
jgi:methionyl-tRNA formyltransferase